MWRESRWWGLCHLNQVATRLEAATKTLNSEQRPCAGDLPYPVYPFLGHRYEERFGCLNHQPTNLGGVSNGFLNLPQLSWLESWYLFCSRYYLQMGLNLRRIAINGSICSIYRCFELLIQTHGNFVCGFPRSGILGHKWHSDMPMYPGTAEWLDPSLS